jgi:hypothetical protein
MPTKAVCGLAVRGFAERSGTHHWRRAVERKAAVALYEALVATNPRIERKGDTMPYTSLNGHMFSVLHKDGTVALRLPEDERTAFLKKYRTTLASQYGSVQPEYVVVPDALLAKTQELKRFFDLSYAYVASLKPKPTAKKKPGARKNPRA